MSSSEEDRKIKLALIVRQKAHELNSAVNDAVSAGVFIDLEVTDLYTRCNKHPFVLTRTAMELKNVSDNRPSKV